MRSLLKKQIKQTFASKSKKSRFWFLMIVAATVGALSGTENQENLKFEDSKTTVVQQSNITLQDKIEFRNPSIN